MTTTAKSAVATAQRLNALFSSDQAVIQQKGRKASSALRVHQVLQRRPVSNLQQAATSTGLSFPTTCVAMELLVELGIAREVTGKRRNRVFAYGGYLDILSDGTEEN